LGPAQCAMDLGDGSERGEYVNQDYILTKLGRPHRNINIMYCYYPLDQGWPARASEIATDSKVTFAWDYAYDDYFPYRGGIGGNVEGEPFIYMRDIRRHGQDVTLTLTMDCALSDDHLIQIARELKPFGRMHLRINHEATGTWFAFNKRYSYQEVAGFFVRFHRIIKQEAPHIQTILCVGGRGKDGGEEMPYEKEFTEAIQTADIWSGDYYLALHWGWPYDVAETGGNSHKRVTVEQVYEVNRWTFDRFKKCNQGQPKPLVISELNTDGDVTGPYDQAEMMRDFYLKLKAESATWLTGVTFYQFRDRGRLALEIEDPNHPEVGIEQPILPVYRDIIHDPYFRPTLTIKEPVTLPAKIRWGSFEDSDGLALPLFLSQNPVFCEVSFEETGLNLIMELNGWWFYKKPGVKTIDLMPAFYQKPLKGPEELIFKIFAPPATGENDPSQGPDWAINYYTEIHQLPEFRIRYQPIETEYYDPTPEANQTENSEIE
jgi:hypothetical protein